MKDLILLGLGAMFVNNIVLTRFLGICPFIGVSRKTDSALGMSFAVFFIMIISSVAGWLIHTFILKPFSLEYLMIISFIFIIASLVQMTEVIIKNTNKNLYDALGIYLPLITTNCAVLGVAFLNITQTYNFIETIIFSVFSGLGFALALLMMSAIRERLELEDVPLAFKGAPIAFIVAAIMSLAFLGFSTLI